MKPLSRPLLPILLLFSTAKASLAGPLITDLLGAESALWTATASRFQAGNDITVSQARLLRAIGELGPNRFRPVSVSEPTGAATPASVVGPGTLAQYLAWHRCGMACGDAPNAGNADVGITGLPRRCCGRPAARRQQGARLCTKGS